MSAYRITFYFCLCVCSFLVQAELKPNPQEPVILASSPLVSEGFITLSFDDYAKSRPEQEPVHIQIATDSRFQNRVRDLTVTAQSQVHLSGFNDGDYFARIVSSAGQIVGQPAEFSVVHRNLTSATLLFGLGSALFIFLISCLVRFTQKNN